MESCPLSRCTQRMLCMFHVFLSLFSCLLPFSAPEAMPIWPTCPGSPPSSAVGMHSPSPELTQLSPVAPGAHCSCPPAKSWLAVPRARSPLIFPPLLARHSEWTAQVSLAESTLVISHQCNDNRCPRRWGSFQGEGEGSADGPQREGGEDDARLGPTALPPPKSYQQKRVL